MNQPSHPRALPIGDGAGAKAEGTDTKRTIFLSQKNEKPPLCALFYKNHTRERPCATPLPTFLGRKVGHPAGELRKASLHLIHPRHEQNKSTTHPYELLTAQHKPIHSHPKTNSLKNKKAQHNPCRTPHFPFQTYPHTSTTVFPCSRA